MYISQDEPLHSVRFSESPEKYLIIVGGSHRVAFESSVKVVQTKMEKFAEKSFGVTAPDYTWSAQDYTTVDGMPYIGRLTDKDEYKNTFVATGFRKWGLGFGIWAGLYLTALIKGTMAKFDTFNPSRDMLAEIAVNQTIDKTKMLICSFTERQKVKQLDDIGIDQGGIVKVDGKKEGVWVAETGKQHFVSLSWTYMDCTLHWNDLDQTYDCPAMVHGLLKKVLSLKDRLPAIWDHRIRIEEICV